MAQKKGGLGKGISALFAENAAEELNDATAVALPVNDIEPNREQPRNIFDGEALSQLSESISEHGVLQPILVRPMTDGSYQIVAGERRWRAAKLAGLLSVPAVIKTLDDSEAAVFALIENLQREDLSPVEESVGIKKLIDEFGLTQEQAARKLSKSRPAITNSLRLLSLPERALELLEEKKLSPGHARALLAISDPESLILVAEDVAKRGLSVRETERLVRSLSKPPRQAKAAGAADPFYKEAELALTSSLGRTVKITRKKTGGTLELEFFDKDDLVSLIKAFEE